MSLLNESQEILRQSVSHFLADNYDLERRRTALAKAGWPQALWQGLADLGILGLPFPEALGGLGLGPLDSAVVMHELGRSLAAEPYLSSVVGLGAVVNALSPAEAAALGAVTNEVAVGTVRVALALFADSGEPGPGDRRLTAGRLTGHAPVVPAAGAATHLLVSADTDSGETALLLIERDAPGVSGHTVPIIDGNDGGAFAFDLARDHMTMVSRAAAQAIDTAYDTILAALTAEIAGIVSALITTTVDFAKQRVQFSKPIAQFQVIRHRLADMYIHSELAESMAMLAATKLDAPEDERRAACAAACARAGLAGRKVGEGAIQIHGGIGTTDELIVGHYFKRLLAINALFGQTYTHVERYARYRDRLGHSIPVV